MQTPTIASEISWLNFNQCVLDEAADLTNPLYERIKFLAIFSSNLDEFFRVKVNQLASTKSTRKSELFQSILTQINQQQEQFGGIWRKKIIPELGENKIQVYQGQDLHETHKKEVERYFKSEVLSYIQVVFIKEGKKEYFLNNRSLYFLVKLKDKQGATQHAYVNIPSDKLNRFRLLSQLEEKHYIISLDEIIRSCLHLIFARQEVVSCYAIKINRDEDYEIEDEDAGNLVHKIKTKVKDRKKGLPTRFLYDAAMPAAEVAYCKKTFQLKKREMIAGGPAHNLFDLFKFPNPLKPKLQNPKYRAIPHMALEDCNSVFDVIDAKNQLLHFPYQSYHYVLQFFNQAAIDSRVTKIQVTLYRISSESLIANALISAAKNGKKVVVFVEVKARFDEDNNLRWAQEMKRAGIKIIYSLPNLKVHAKIALVTMQMDEKTTKDYAFLGTGNFNENTAAIYADHGFFTAQEKYTADMHKVFTFLKTKEKKGEMNHLLVAGFRMKERILELMDVEIANKKAGKKAEILLKVNGLDEKDIIQKLYEASAAGVPVTLIVRGICTLRPGVEGQSENISVHRIVDMFLEHARVYRFHNGGEEKMYLSSADMMNRNLNKRIEVGYPIEDADLQAELNQIIQFQLQDNTKKRVIDSDGKNVLKQNFLDPKRAQVDTYNWLAEKNNTQTVTLNYMECL